MSFLPLSLITLLFLLMLFATENLYRFTKAPPEWTRKLQHVLSGLFASAFPWIFSSPVDVLALGVIMTIVLWALRKLKLLHSLHGVKRKTFGEFYFLLSAVVLSFLAWDNHLLYLIPILTLTFSDTLAAIIGTNYQKVTYSVRGHIKSLEGSSAFFVCTFLVVFLSQLLLSDIDPFPLVLIALNIALFVTWVEGVCRNGRDNILIPLSTYFLLLHLVGAPQIRLLQEFGIASAITVALVVYLLRKKRRARSTP